MAKKSDQSRRPAETIKFSSDAVADHSRATRRFGALLVVQGAEADLGTLVVCDRPVTLGRDPDVELPLADGSISRRHCRVEREDTGRYLLRDLGSTNGTTVNGAKVKEPVALGEGDKIFLGASILKFSFADGFDVDYQAKVESMVTTDALTGLLSKRRFDGAFAGAVARALHDAAALAVLIIDMDGLKQINDTHGHEFGGYAITEVASIIRDVVGEAGDCCRFGGDEFIAILPGLDKTAACAVAESLRDAVATHHFEKDGVRVMPTVSIGVSALPDDGDSEEDLFRAADRALYRAKSAGRNQVAV